MKKYSLIFVVLFVLAFCCAAVAADGEWTAWEASLADASAIECEIVEPAFENKENKEILGEVSENDWSNMRTSSARTAPVQGLQPLPSRPLIRMKYAMFTAISR